MAESDRRTFLSLAAALGLSPSVVLASPAPKLHRISDPATLLAATRMLLAEDRLGTFITVDAEGCPRARTVFLSEPDADLTLWIGTRIGSRKLAQIADHSKAAIHVNLDGKSSYASLGGAARRVTDKALMEAKNPYQGDMRKQFFPRYPDDFALIAFAPQWLEVMTDTLTGQRETWQPEGMTI